MSNLKFTPKEQFIVASVRMITDERSKKLSREARQNMLNYIRERLGVTKEEWHEVALNIDQTMRQITEFMIHDYNETNVQDDELLSKIDSSVRDTIKDMDLDALHAESELGKKMLKDTKGLRERFGI